MPNEKRIVAIALLTERELERLGSGVDLAWPVDSAPCFGELIPRIDAPTGTSGAHAAGHFGSSAINLACGNRKLEAPCTLATGIRASEATAPFRLLAQIAVKRLLRAEPADMYAEEGSDRMGVEIGQTTPGQFRAQIAARSGRERGAEFVHPPAPGQLSGPTRSLV